MPDGERREIIKKRVAWIMGCEAKEVNDIRRDMIASGEIPRVAADKCAAEDI